ncbi:MAG: hypothetical protein HY658_11460, partial [Actinobacteria bacterium]|nr:hypothetical protein [Actinomycetota bacterium]
MAGSLLRLLGLRRRKHAASPPFPAVPLFLALVLVTGAIAAFRTGVAERVIDRLTGGGGTGQEQPDVPVDLNDPVPDTVNLTASGPINTVFAGITTFRGNAARNWYGEGPVPADPEVIWRFPKTGQMCSVSDVLGEPQEWCGMGWTGQPNVIVGEDGSVELRFGAYDARYHFLDGLTGEPVREDFVTGDLAKGSATTDPLVPELYYAGSRDNHLRVLALDGDEPRELWSLDARTSVGLPMWNDDWDGAPLALGDYLLAGGENGWFYVIKLNRSREDDGTVSVDPVVNNAQPSFDGELI